MKTKQRQPELFDASRRSGPPAQKTRTSIAAAAAIADMAGTLRGRVYAFLVSRGRHGATMEEIELGVPMKLSSVCARISELRALDLVKHNGQIRTTTAGRSAMVFVCKDAGKC